MKIVKNGLIKIHEEFSELKSKWDGYEGKPIKAKVLQSILDMTFVSNTLRLFRGLGMKETDVDIVPCPNGNVQFECETESICLIVEVSEKYYEANK